VEWVRIVAYITVEAGEDCVQEKHDHRWV
jgi:hypothetical protein